MLSKYFDINLYESVINLTMIQINPIVVASLEYSFGSIRHTTCNTLKKIVIPNIVIDIGNRATMLSAQKD